MKATTGSSSATMTESSSPVTTNVESNGSRRNGRTSSRSVLLQVESQQQQQQTSRQRNNRRSTNEVSRVPCDDEVTPGAADETEGTASQNNNYKVEAESSCETTKSVNEIETNTSVLGDVCCSDSGRVDEKVVSLANGDEVQPDDTGVCVATTTSSNSITEFESASCDEDEDTTVASNMDVSDDIDVPLIIDDRQLSHEDEVEDDMVIELSEEVNDNCNADRDVVESAVPSSICGDTAERESSTEKFELESDIETVNGSSDIISGLASIASEEACAASTDETKTGETDKFIVLGVIDDCDGKNSNPTEDKSLPIHNDQPSIVDDSIPEIGDVGRTEPEVTVLELTPSPVVVIEPEAPEDVMDCQSSTGRAADGSVDGDEDDDDYDDEDQRHYESNAGSPSDSATANFSTPLVSRVGVRPAEVIEVVCGNQRARLDVRLLVAGLIRASNNTTSRAPCVLVEASAAATLAAATEGETNVEKADEVAENLSGGCDNSGSSSRILTLTPNQFQKYSGRGTARDWKRSTRHYGASLKSLISRKILILNPDSYGCYCSRCIGDSGSSTRVEGPEDLTGERATSPKSNSSTSVDQENLPPRQAPPTSCVDDNHQALSFGGRTTAAMGINRGTIEPNHGQVITSGAIVGSSRKRPSIKGFGGCVDDGSGLPSVSKRRKGSGSSLHGHMIAAEDQELTSIGGSWIKSSSGSKEEQMANIIRELRNYKNNLSEKIDSNRRHSTGNGTVTTPSLVSGQSSPVAASYSSTGLQSIPSLHYVTDDVSSMGNPIKSIEKVTRSEYGLQPFAGRDLNATSSSSSAVGGTQQLHLSASVRPPKSSSARRTCDGTSGASRPQGRRRSQLPFKTDEHGALDLSATSASIKTSQGRSRTVPAKVAKSVAAVSVEGDGVLDLRVGKPDAVHDKATQGLSGGVVRGGGGGGGMGPVSWPPLASLFSASNLQKMLFWTVNDVVDFASRVPGCNAYAETLRQFGIDGSSLALLSVDQMTNILGMRVDVAKSLRNAVDHAVSSPPTPLMSMTPFLPSTSSSAAAFALSGPFGGNSPV